LIKVSETEGRGLASTHFPKWLAILGPPRFQFFKTQFVLMMMPNKNSLGAVKKGAAKQSRINKTSEGQLT